MKHRKIYATLLLIAGWAGFYSCDLIMGGNDDVELFPATVIGPKDGSLETCLTVTVVIGSWNSSVNAVTASQISVGKDYFSGPSFMDYLVFTKDTTNKSSYKIIREHIDYPYPPKPPTSMEIVSTSKAYFILSGLDPSVKYFWKIVHDAGDFQLDVTPFRSFTTMGKTEIVSATELAKVNGGSFCIGKTTCSTNPSTNIEVELSDFQIGKYEITNKQFAAFLNQRGSTPLSADHIDIFSSWRPIQYNFQSARFEPLPGRENLPANSVMWEGALAFSNFVGGRLPTSAEWEFAAKGGNLTNHYAYSGDNDPEKVAWSLYNAGNFREVGTKQPNELGLCDMTGNVREWCADWFASLDEIYTAGKYKNPQGPTTGTMRILKGGSVLYTPFLNIWTEKLYPGSGWGQYSWKDTGFRIAKD